MNKLLAFIGIFLMLTGCKSQKKAAETQSSPSVWENPSAEISPENLAESYNRFALDLFKQIQDNSENMVFSPYSISTVMAMCYSGAGGETATEMAEVLYFPPKGEFSRTKSSLTKSPETKSSQTKPSNNSDSQNILDPAVKALNIKVLANDTLKGTELKLANAIWAQKGFGFLPEYIENLGKWYDAPLTEMDFVMDAARENARQEINRWVEDNTRQRIKDLISRGVLDASTRMVLTNAIYFNGKWQWAFDKNMTGPSLFHRNSMQSDMIDFMHQTRTIPYYEDEEIKAIKLPYRHGRLSMMIILPGKVEGWELISRVIDYERLMKMEPGFEPREVSLSIPKFSFEMKTNLSKELSSMGMDKAFSKGADFSGMNGKLDLFIDEVIHKAFIEVSENGTEAAAATAAVISLKSALRDEPEVFNADHPFLYLIRDHETGSIIFMGRFVNPK